MPIFSFPEEVQKWLLKDYPRIRRLAQRKKAMIFFGDEAGVRSDHHAGTTWALKGKTPVVSSTGARFGLNLISAVSGQGEFRFMTVKGKVDAVRFIDMSFPTQRCSHIEPEHLIQIESEPIRH